MRCYCSGTVLMKQYITNLTKRISGVAKLGPRLQLKMPLRNFANHVHNFYRVYVKKFKILLRFLIEIDRNRFLPRCMECRRGLAMRIPSVRPSVHSSNACIVTKRKKDMFKFLYHTKEHLS